MTYKLSYSSFKLFFECKRCFWLKIKGGMSRISSSFSTSLPNTIEKLILDDFVPYRNNHQLPPSLKRFKGFELIDKTRHKKWKDSGLTYEDKERGLKLLAKPDDILIHKNDRKRIKIFDIKTKGTQIKKPKLNDLTKDVNKYWYRNQVEFYGYVFSKSGFKVDPISILYFIIPKEAEGFNIKITRLIYPVQINFPSETLDRRLDNIKELLDKDKPPNIKRELDIPVGIKKSNGVKYKSCPYCKHNFYRKTKEKCLFCDSYLPEDSLIVVCKKKKCRKQVLSSLQEKFKGMNYPRKSKYSILLNQKQEYEFSVIEDIFGELSKYFFNYEYLPVVYSYVNKLYVKYFPKSVNTKTKIFNKSLLKKRYKNFQVSSVLIKHLFDDYIKLLPELEKSLNKHILIQIEHYDMMRGEGVPKEKW